MLISKQIKDCTTTIYLCLAYETILEYLSIRRQNAWFSLFYYGVLLTKHVYNKIPYFDENYDKAIKL